MWTQSWRPHAEARDKERKRELSTQARTEGRARNDDGLSSTRRPREGRAGGLDGGLRGDPHGGERRYLGISAPDRGKSVRRRVSVERSTPVVLGRIAQGRRLSEGGLIQASVRARLLGIPLLRVDATIAMVPAHVAASHLLRDAD